MRFSKYLLNLCNLNFCLIGFAQNQGFSNSGFWLKKSKSNLCVAFLLISFNFMILTFCLFGFAKNQGFLTIVLKGWILVLKKVKAIFTLLFRNLR